MWMLGDNMSFAPSETIWQYAYRCAEQKITRGGSWDGLPGDPARPLIIPNLSSPRSALSTMFSPLVWMSLNWCLQCCAGRLKIVQKLVIKDDLREFLMR